MPPTDPSAALCCIAVSFIVSAVFNLAKSAAVYLDDSTLKNRAASGEAAAQRLERILAKHERLEQAVSAVSSICTTAAVIGCCLLAAPELPGVRLVSWLALAAFTVLFYAAAVHSPRRVASYLPEIAYPLSGCLSVLYTVSSPLAAVIVGVSSVAVRLTGKDPGSPPGSVTEEEIRMLVDEGSERGTIEESEMKMINNIFEFDDRDVSEVMTHRTELSAVEINATLDEVAQIAIESGYSRLPVYDGDIDKICGIIYAKDLIKYIHRPQDFRLADNIRKPICVPESGSCSDVFALMKREKVQLAIVVDEYGGTFGVVTMEDLVESIVGSIQDEYDHEEAATQIAEGVYLLDGSTSISDAELLLDFYAPDDSEADTLGGFVIELLGGVPHSPGDPRTASFGGITFSVVRSDERRIEKIRAVIDKEE